MHSTTHVQLCSMLKVSMLTRTSGLFYFLVCLEDDAGCAAGIIHKFPTQYVHNYALWASNSEFLELIKWFVCT